VNDDELLRYSRQIMLPQFDYAGQQALLEATVLIVGLGGLGSPVAMYLAAAGVGKLILNDFDEVDVSNLQRQVVHGENSIGVNKALSAQQQIQQINATCKTELIQKKLDEETLSNVLQQVNVVVDCSDNFATRQLLNIACVKSRKALVSGAAIRFEGQLTVFHNQTEEDACYHCLYGEGSEDDLNCSENGVIAPLVGVIGSLQALETIKVLSGTGETLRNRLLLFDGMTQEYRLVKFKKDLACSVCAA